MELVHAIVLLTEAIHLESSNLDFLSIAGVSDVQARSLGQPLEPTEKKKKLYKFKQIWTGGLRDGDGALLFCSSVASWRDEADDIGLQEVAPVDAIAGGGDSD